MCFERAKREDPHRADISPFEGCNVRRCLIFLFAHVLCNVKVPQFINITILVGWNHSEPNPDIVLLQILLCQVLQVPLGKVTVRSDSDLALLTGNSDRVTKSTGLATDLNPLLEEPSSPWELLHFLDYSSFVVLFSRCLLSFSKENKDYRKPT
ncbi:hypothetical protein PanWU01x14_273160 [Parasponia andersonii]|uniref:Uncharacterized protein n=1 Tax=Parasponia andersonii TaxID=3476 RepID=A0A2P5B453_PARAD|nr:hypothetical protein PanWU01x14_273160 [Parasponia andersonii]